MTAVHNPTGTELATVTKGSPDQIPIVFTFDAAYGNYAAVAIASVLCHAKQHTLVHCITNKISCCGTEAIKRLSRKFDASIFMHIVESAEFSAWKTGYHFSPANYYRIKIPEMISEPKALYLDCDLIVTCDLSDLLSIDLGENLLAGVVDIAGGATTRMPRRDGDPYINSGVLLLNLDRMREMHFAQSFREVYARFEDQVTWPDQCVINELAVGRKLLIDERWNVQSTNYQSLSLKDKVGHFDRRGIFHASGRRKPWMSWADPWLANLWASYARLTDLSFEDLIIKPRTDFEQLMLAKMYDAERRWEEASAVKSMLLSKLMPT